MVRPMANFFKQRKGKLKKNELVDCQKDEQYEQEKEKPKNNDVEEWEKETKRSISERKVILNFIANQATDDQVKDGYYKIKENCIEFFTKDK